MHTHTNRPNSSLDWVLSHWAHFTVHRFIFVLYYFVYRCILHACVPVYTPAFTDTHSYPRRDGLPPIIYFPLYVIGLYIYLVSVQNNHIVHTSYTTYQKYCSFYCAFNRYHNLTPFSQTLFCRTCIVFIVFAIFP